MGTFKDVVHRDRHGWRLFTQQDLERLDAQVNQVQVFEGGDRLNFKGDG
jgi:hypothetical protein